MEYDKVIFGKCSILLNRAGMYRFSLAHYNYTEMDQINIILMKSHGR